MYKTFIQSHTKKIPDTHTEYRGLILLKITYFLGHDFGQPAGFLPSTNGLAPG